MTELLKGAPLAKKLYKEIKEKVAEYGKLTLAVVLVEGDSASEIYTNMIKKNCKKAGVEFMLVNLPSDISEADFLGEIEKLNGNADVTGMIVMMPLPKHIDDKKVCETISPLKDIDGVNPYNAGKNLLGDEGLFPSTALACKEILSLSEIDTNGKHVVILGRSNIVGKPLANILIQKAVGANATVTVCHSRTNNIKEICKSADILVSAIGVAGFVTKEFVSEGQVVVDVGMNEGKDEEGNYKLVGDVLFDEVSEIVKSITPVPGGVSPLTHTSLFKNLLKATELQNNR